MSYFDDASLVMIPSGYKEDKVYSVKPIDGSGDLDFTRASSATRIGPTGLIEKTRTNELSYSYEFDNVYWNIDGVSATANTIANPLNNAVNADTLTTTALGSGVEYRLRATTTMSTSRVYSYSIYVKKIDHDYFYLRTLPNNAFTIFDIQNGTIPTKSGGHFDAQIENIGSGWYRCSVSFITPSSFANNLVDLGFSFSDTNFSGSVPTGRQMYWYGVQLEESLVATSYIETTTTAVTVGSYNNVPRLNYTAGSTSSCPSLLLEPQRTNSLPHSEYMGSYATNGVINIEHNSAISPEGLQNATNLIADSTYSRHHLSQSALATSSNATAVIYAKPNGHDYIAMSFINGSNSSGCGIIIDLTDGSLLSQRKNAESSFTYNVSDSANGFKKVEFILSTTGSGVNFFSWGSCVSSFNWNAFTKMPNFTGDDTSGILIYGVQVEMGATYPSSYIPTFGATVTRVADTIEKTGVSSLIGQTEGTLFCEIDIIAPSPNYHTIFQVYGDANNRVALGQNINSTDLFLFIKSAGTSTIVFSSNSTGRFKIALAYKSGDNILYVNGVAALTSTRAFTFATPLSTIFLNNVSGQEIGILNDHKSILFKTRLSNTQLADLTS